MSWWIWVISGLFLLIAELVITTDFYLFFLGLAGVITGSLVGILTALNVIYPTWIEWFFYSCLALFLLFSVKRKFVSCLFKHASLVEDEYVGKEIMLLEDIEAGQTGQGEIRGANWVVRNESSQGLKRDTKHLIVKRDGIVLVVKE